MADQIATLGPEDRSIFLFRSMRVRTGLIAEGNVIAHAMSGRTCIRSAEASLADAAMIPGAANPQTIPQDPTERFYALSKSYKGKNLSNAVMFDVKSFRWQPQFQIASRQRTRDTLKLCLAKISAMSKTQADKCHAIVLASVMDPDFVAVVPKPYLRIHESNENTAWIKLGLAVTASTAEMCPFPPELSPFIMPIRYLSTALESIAACASGAENVVYNPYTRLAWPRLSEWQPSLSPFDDLMPADNATEFKIRELLWQSFHDQGQSTEFQVKIPHYAPITSDIRLDHSSGTSLFIEIKVAAIKVTQLANGKYRLQHMSRTTPHAKRGIFTLLQTAWDYLLSLPSANSATAWLLKKEDWPQTFWHALVRPDEWLSFDYDDSTFLDSRKVRLNAGPAALVQDICRIVCDQGVPQPTDLTADQVLQFAGPCPRELIRDVYTVVGEGQGLEEVVSPEGAQEEDLGDPQDGEVVDNEEDDEEADEEEGENEEAEEGEEEGNQDAVAWRFNRFTTSAAASRKTIRGGNEMIRTGQLFKRLMDESRLKGDGCPIYLGNRHPFGSIGFVRYQWTDTDKRVFDLSRRPPCWVGNMSNETPMVTLLQQNSKWRGEYAPLEGTVKEIESIEYAHPCLVICYHLAREIEHLSQTTWLVPSNLIPKVSVGKMKSTGQGRKFRCPLFLADKSSIDQFAVNNSVLHQTISAFLKGQAAVEVGIGAVPVDPAPYLKTFREYRTSSERDYERCFSMVRHR